MKFHTALELNFPINLQVLLKLVGVNREELKDERWRHNFHLLYYIPPTQVKYPPSTSLYKFFSLYICTRSNEEPLLLQPDINYTSRYYVSGIKVYKGNIVPGT